MRSLPLFSSRNARLSHVFPRNSITRSIFESNRIESNFPSLSIRRYKHKCLILRELKRGDDPSFSIFAYANSLRAHSYVYESACVQVHVHTRARACIYIVLFMENRATESDRQSRQGACAAFRGWVTNLSTYANQSSNPRRYVVITANPRFHCSHPSRGSSFSSPSPSPSSHTTPDQIIRR